MFTDDNKSPRLENISIIQERMKRFIGPKHEQDYSWRRVAPKNWVQRAGLMLSNTNLVESQDIVVPIDDLVTLAERKTN